MPGLNNSESRQVTNDSQGLRVTVSIADDSTSNNNNNTADDSTSDPTNNNNYADDLTSTINSDDLTSASPTVVPIGRGGRSVQDRITSQIPLLSVPELDEVGSVATPQIIYLSDVVLAEANQSKQILNHQLLLQGLDGRLDAVLAGVEDIFILTGVSTIQTSASKINGTRSSSVIFLDSDGEEVEEEEENVVGPNDDHCRSSCVEHLFNRRRLIFDINERYAESLIQQEIHRT